jgi:CRP-like cAMP-binding protein
MFVLLEGEVALLHNGKETRKAGPYEVAGALPLLAGGSQPESAVAGQAVHALRIDQHDFYDVMAEDFSLTRGILRALVGLAAGGG